MNRIKKLILNYLREEITEAERRELDDWLVESTENRLLFDQINDPILMGVAMAKMDAFHEEGVWERVNSHAAVVVRASSSKSWRWMAAAAVLAVLGMGAWWWARSTRSTNLPPVAALVDIAPPAHGKATLTLANGQTVSLDSAISGAVGMQGGTRIGRGAGGGLAYKLQVAHPAELLYNTLTNPRGSQVVTLTLSDGTKVWLNAESSIRYPAAFLGEDRRVEITGEAYFEVNKSPSRAFIVKMRDGAEVEVLGTDFDVNAYESEPILKTTLLQGSVRIARNPSNPLVGVNTNKIKLSVVLKPGEQAQIATTVFGAKSKSDTGQIKVIHQADVDEVMAWKNGFFRFNNASIETIMKSAARWYDVDVEFQTDNKLDFVATVSRDVPISKLLKLLELTDRVHFKIDGKKIIVLP